LCPGGIVLEEGDVRFSPGRDPGGRGKTMVLSHYGVVLEGSHELSHHDERARAGVEHAPG
jgi:hypothetical protein